MFDSSGRGDIVAGRYAIILPWIFFMILILLVIIRRLEKRQISSIHLLIGLLSALDMGVVIFRTGTSFILINRYGLSVISFAIHSVVYLVMKHIEKKAADKVRAAIKNIRRSTTGNKSD